MRMKKWHYWVIAVLLLLIITNPGTKAFKEHLGRDEYAGLKREYNFFVASYYTDRNSGDYIGIVGNFILLKKHSAFLPK